MAKALTVETGKNDQHGNGEYVYQIEAVVAHQKWPKMIDNSLCASQKSHKKFCVSFYVESDEQNCVLLVTHNLT